MSIIFSGQKRATGFGTASPFARTVIERPMPHRTEKKSTRTFSLSQPGSTTRASLRAVPNEFNDNCRERWAILQLNVRPRTSHSSRRPGSVAAFPVAPWRVRLNSSFDPVLYIRQIPAEIDPIAIHAPFLSSRTLDRTPVIRMGESPPPAEGRGNCRDKIPTPARLTHDHSNCMRLSVSKHRKDPALDGMAIHEDLPDPL